MPFNFEEFAKTHFVHPETVGYLKARQQDGGKPYYEIGVDAARKLREDTAAKYGGSVELNGTEKELRIPSPFVKDGIPVTIYRPTSCTTMPSPTILVYFHGGGNTVGSMETHHSVCRTLARDTPCIVVNVEYRLAPEFKFPANHDDAKCVVEWIAANKSYVGGDANSKLGVCGDSAGGRLAASVCHEAYKMIDFAVLVYPSVSYATSFPSHEEFKDGPTLSKPVRDWFTKQYIAEEDFANTRASPILNKDFSYLPPTLLIVADLDPLRDGCYAYCDKLKEAGVKVELKAIQGVPHGFWSLPGAYKETTKDAYSAAVKFMKEQNL